MLLRKAPRGIWIGLSLAVVILATTATASADFSAELAGSFEGALDSGNWMVALGLVFLAGVATSLTPCLYPMIAITVSVFGARQAETRFKGAMLSTCFVLGIAALFTPLGIAASLTGAFFGSALSSPWVLGALAIIFLVLAASMFGAFEMNLPPSLQNKLSQVGGVGYKGAFGLGFASGLIAAPCAGPVLTFLLTWIGSTGNVAFGGLSLFIYAIGVGMLVWIVGTFAISLPKTGRWVEYTKSVFGIVMVVVALWFLRDLLPFTRPAERETWMIVGALGLLLTGVAIGGIHLTFHNPSKVAKFRKATGIALTVAGATASIWWLEALPPGAKIAWMHDYEQAQAVATERNRPMLVDFTASWCGACGELERETFSDPRVVAKAQELGIIPVKVDLSPGEDTPERREKLASYNQRGLPLVVLHKPDGSEAGRVTSFVEADEFLEIMQTVQ